jgi:Concanavalin A-like lectin/glucanases superfamily
MKRIVNGVRHRLGLMVAAGLMVGHVALASTVAYYRFEEGSKGSTATGTNTILDSSGNGLNGTPYGSVVYTSNVPVSIIPQTGATNTLSLSFDGSTGRIFIPDYPLLTITNSLTLEALIYASAPGGGPYNLSQIIFRGDDRGFLDPYFLGLTGGNLLFEVNDAVGNRPSIQAPITLNQWHHVAGTLDGNTGDIRLYIDCALVASNNTSIRPFGSLTGPNPGLGIGNLQSVNYSEYFKGLIDEVRISDTALTPDQFLDAPPLRIAAINVIGTNVTLQFTSVPNNLHNVQSSTNLVSGTWATITNNIVGNGGLITFIDTGAATNSPARFYRIDLHF